MPSAGSAYFGMNNRFGRLLALSALHPLKTATALTPDAASVLGAGAVLRFSGGEHATPFSGRSAVRDATGRGRIHLIKLNASRSVQAPDRHAHRHYLWSQAEPGR